MRLWRLSKPRFATGGMGSQSIVGKVKEFIYLLEDLTPDQVQPGYGQLGLSGAIA